MTVSSQQRRGLGDCRTLQRMLPRITPHLKGEYIYIVECDAGFIQDLHSVAAPFAFSGLRACYR